MKSQIPCRWGQLSDVRHENAIERLSVWNEKKRESPISGVHLLRKQRFRGEESRRVGAAATVRPSPSLRTIWVE